MQKIICWFSALATMVSLALGTSSRAADSAPPSEAYTWHNVVIGGGGFVTGIIFHPRQKGLIYARTDVGGAYRWDDIAQRWIPLTDWVGPADVNLTGIESIAVDPSDPNRVYLAAGTYTWAEATILRSDDQGRTFQVTEIPFRMGGNEMGSFSGERLAVDPNQGKILFFGSRQDGLWKSMDRGTTWEKVKGFPNISFVPEPEPTNNSRPWFRFRQQPVGIVCVLFDPASGHAGLLTPVIYAAVSTTETNLYRSSDMGLTWQPVPGQPVGLRPNHLVLAPDGMLYASYGNEPGPNGMTDGAVWKFNPATDVWTNITPLDPKNSDHGFGYGAVTVDAQHPSVIMASTLDRWQPHDEIFRSTNGGMTWTPLLAGARFDHAFAPYTKAIKPHWMGSLQIDPFNSNHALFSTGYGLWSCDNLTAADSKEPTRWSFTDAGLEETVPLALISPPAGAHLLTGLGDIDGFRHDDLDVSPPNGAFAGPRFTTTEDIAFAGQQPNLIVRTGTGGNSPVLAAISMDGGQTWNALASAPPEGRGGGTIAISANGATIVWTPRRGIPCRSENRGTNWAACLGIGLGTRVVADTVISSRFYAFDPQAGKLFASTNGAVSFAATKAMLPPEAKFGRESGFGGLALLSATPNRDGDLWLTLRANGLYHSTDGGVTFSKLAQVSEAYSLGFGQGGPRPNVSGIVSGRHNRTRPRSFSFRRHRSRLGAH